MKAYNLNNDFRNYISTIPNGEKKLFDILTNVTNDTDLLVKDLDVALLGGINMKYDEINRKYIKAEESFVYPRYITNNNILNEDADDLTDDEILENLKKNLENSY
jgi:hypothetical protein